jgi:hypothetical protein
MACVKSALLVVLVLAVAAAITGCSFCKEGKLPEETLLPPPPLGPERPSLSYAVSFLPPDEERNIELTKELVQQLSESGLFAEVRSQSAEAELTVSMEMVDVNLSTGETLLISTCTGGLWPVSIPYRYELKATARRATGLAKEYTLTDESSCRVWLPGLLQHSFSHLIEPRSQAIRRNLYRTLLRRMVEDGLLLDKEKKHRDDRTRGSTRRGKTVSLIFWSD